jgi:hypothetical protein
MSSNSVDSTDSPKSISKVVSNHADRVMDELFADIEGLLGDSPSNQNERQAVLPASNKTNNQSTARPTPTYPQLPPDTRVHGESAFSPPATDATLPPAPQKNTWRTVIVGLGLASIAIGGGLWFLARQGKLMAPNLQLPTLNSAANGDVQFSDYLRRAVGKLDTKAAPSGQVSIPNPPDQAAALPNAPTATVGATNLARVIQGSPLMAEFSIGGKLQQLRGGEKIGSTGWTLTTVINPVENEVIIKRDNGEIRSLKVGQSF